MIIFKNILNFRHGVTFISGFKLQEIELIKIYAFLKNTLYSKLKNLDQRWEIEMNYSVN